MSATMADLEKTEKTESTPLRTGEEEINLKSPDYAPQELDIDLKDRDPNNINEHVKVTFSELFAEPESEVYSFDKIWSLSFKLFTLTKVWVYRIVTVVFAIPLAIIWGLVFACLAFCTNWCYTPAIRCFKIELFPIQKLCEVCLSTILIPTFAAIGMIFSQIKITVRKDQAALPV